MFSTVIGVFEELYILCESIEGGLDSVAYFHSPFASISEQGLEHGLLLGGVDDKDVPDAGLHESGKRVVDHGLAVDG